MTFSSLKNKAIAFYTKRKKAVFIVLALAITLLVLSDQYIFNHEISHAFESVRSGVLVFDLIGATIALILLTIVASTVVIEALIDISVGFTLIIFLAQSYCSSEMRNLSGDTALQTLIVFGIGYILVNFGTKLFKGVMGFLGTLEEAKWYTFKFIIIIVFLALAWYFVWIVSEVAGPIISGICVYV